MNPNEHGHSETAAALQLDFDRSFSEPKRTGTAVSDDLLAVRLGTDSYALRFSEIAGLFSDKKITRLPSHLPALVGIACVRGAILPVYDLSVLFGYGTIGTSRWLVLAASEPVAFAFDGFEGHLRLPRAAIVPHEGVRDVARSHVREVARAPGLHRPIVHIPSVLDAITRQLPRDAARKER